MGLETAESCFIQSSLQDSVLRFSESKEPLRFRLFEKGQDMNAIVAYRKAGLRFATLILLGMVLAIVAKPTTALALDATCQQTCLQLEVRCVTLCHAARIDDCSVCVGEFESCDAQCGD
jgi:hypothetical protein